MLEPYELNDSLLLEVHIATEHGAVEVLAEQWKIRNIAYANLPKSRYFPILTTQTTSTASSQLAVGPPQGTADNARKSGRKPTRGLGFRV